MKRRQYSKKEEHELRALKRENKDLRREVSSLRKQFSRLNPERFEAAQEQFRQRKIDEKSQTIDEKKELQKIEDQAIRWACKHCATGVLIIKRFQHPSRGETYYRKCSECDHKTRLQEFNDRVVGIFEENTKAEQ